MLEDRQRRRSRRRAGRPRARPRPRPARSRCGRPPRTPCSPNSGRGRPRRRTAGRGRAGWPASGPSSTGPGAARPRPRGTARTARRRSGRPARSGSESISRPRPARIPRREAGTATAHGTDFVVEVHRSRHSCTHRAVPRASFTGFMPSPWKGPRASQPGGRGAGSPLTAVSRTGHGSCQRPVPGPSLRKDEGIRTRRPSQNRRVNARSNAQSQRVRKLGSAIARIRGTRSRPTLIASRHASMRSQGDSWSTFRRGLVADRQPKQSGSERTPASSSGWRVAARPPGA